MAPGSAAAQRLDGAGSSRLDSWIAIAADGSVTAYTGKCELGHGLYTAQTQLIAEELSVPFDRVKLIQCDTALTPDQGTTSGAQSHPTNFNQSNLALAGATAREALLQRASTRLGVPVDQLAVKDGVVRAKADPSKKRQLRRVGRRTNIRRSAQPGRETKTSERMDDPWKAGAARRDSRQWRPVSSSTSTTCACPVCCTARSSGRRRSAQRWSASTRASVRSMPGS